MVQSLRSLSMSGTTLIGLRLNGILTTPSFQSAGGGVNRDSKRLDRPEDFSVLSKIPIETMRQGRIRTMAAPALAEMPSSLNGCAFA